MRKPAGRFARKAGNVFLIEIKPELFALGVMHDDGCTTFSKTFYETSEADVDLESFQDKLFTVSVQVSFFRNSIIYPVSKLAPSELDAIPLSRQVIKPFSRPYDPDNPFGHDGPFPYQGGHLVEVKSALTPESSSDATVIKSDLNCDTDLEIIQTTEISTLYVNHDLKERLVSCYLSDRNVDAFKARVFDDCPALTNPIVLDTHWYKPKQMPLLGLGLNESNNAWEPVD